MTPGAPAAEAITIRRIDQGRYKDRYYTVSGDPRISEDQRLPSVTTVLSIISKPALIPWATNTALASVREVLVAQLAKEPVWAVNEETIDTWIAEARKRPDTVRDEAADLGTRAHIYIDRLLRGGELLELTPDIEPSINAFWAWYEATGLDAEITEYPLYSLTYLYAGTLDARATRDGRKVILDWKTSSGIYDEMALQAAAYWNADGEMTGEWADEVWIIRFPKKVEKKPFEARKVADPQAAFRGFTSALDLWRTMREPLWTASE